jgi:hypothetical protein
MMRTEEVMPINKVWDTSLYDYLVSGFSMPYFNLIASVKVKPFSPFIRSIPLQIFNTKLIFAQEFGDINIIQVH